ncbi:hypothetical protein UFOVP33_58 [uncultured Caudovirales phage]|uniref:Uncharacterized protein n=1 Tax=uncultured Caudovirales phage TaxID=2100421 RepID=A0A6J5KPI5_9CAUD|nr:hypothetical protein UFOVP33_58 [uncultured Caudovirales phage]
MKQVLSFLGSRTFQFLVIPILVLIWFIATDPSKGADTMLRVQLWAQALMVTGLAYLIAKAMLGSASSEELYDQSLLGNYAAGIAYVGVCLLRAMVLGGLLAFFAQVQR